MIYKNNILQIFAIKCKEVCVQLSTPADNVTLLALLLNAVLPGGRRCRSIFLPAGLTAANAPQQRAAAKWWDGRRRCRLPAGRPAANPPHPAAAVDRWDRQTDRQTDRRTRYDTIRDAILTCARKPT